MSFQIRNEDKAASVLLAVKHNAPLPLDSDDLVLWLDVDTLIFVAALTHNRLDLPHDCLKPVLRVAVNRFLEPLKEKFPNKNLIMVPCLTSSPTFRHDVYSEYKANRKGKRSPPFLQELRDAFIQMYPSLSMHKYEADDLVGILHSIYPGHVCCSSDKDLMQIPGSLYNPRTKKFNDISRVGSLYCRLYQWIVGDTADGYGGIWKVGDKGATKLLHPYFHDLDDEKDIDLSAIVEEVMLLYDTQNKKAAEKDIEPRDPLQMFAVSQILTDFLEDPNNVSLPDPLTYLQEFLFGGPPDGVDS